MNTALFGKLGQVLPLALLSSALALLPASATAATRQIAAGGTTTIAPNATSTGELQYPELNTGAAQTEGAGSFNRPRPGQKKGTLPKKALPTPIVPTSSVAEPGSEFNFSVNGLNHRDQRTADHGNQFSVEPPDQGFCIGNGFVVEAVNSVLSVYDTSGTLLKGPQALNPFFGYPSAIVRPATYGDDVIDPICHYDPDHNRFVVAITTLHRVGTTRNFNGKNTIDLAVSNDGDPTGTWTVYHIPAQNDGTDGTPNHGCTLDGVTPGPCFQDYPHIGGDANGIYITTDEFDLFGPNYHAAQVFAFSKAELATHPTAISVTLVENLFVDALPGYAVWPATSPIGQYSNEANGTEYFLSTIADACPSSYCTAARIGLWALTNTESLNSALPELRMTSRTINSEVYVDPPKPNQKAGDIPLGECINDTTTPTVAGAGCWRLLFGSEPSHDEVESHPDANDAKMQQTWYVNGTLWGSSGTGVQVGGQLRAGVAWFAVSPKINGDGKVEGQVKLQGYVALANNNLTYPALAMGENGKGAIAFSVLGDDYYPSAGYALIDTSGAVGSIHIAAAGAGPTDGFTSYKAEVGNPPRTRWGDYGAALTDGSSIWIASEYIAQTCTFEQFYPSPPSPAGFGSCGATRTTLGNWATRITKLTP
jgi:hypothetical protein